MVEAAFALAGLATGFGALLGFAAKAFRVQDDPLVEKINALLPQTQCGQCGYPGCKPYAAAIAGGDAINKCPPGGEATIVQLADLLGERPLPLDAARGDAGEAEKVAGIREEDCIGCAKCIPACPVDAILGAPRHAHTVIAAECTGCDLCVEPCPVDCIDMIPRTPPVSTASNHLRQSARRPPGVSGDPSGRAPRWQAPVSPPAHPCIRCGLCEPVCSANLAPAQLYRLARNGERGKARAHRLFDCIECGACARACPSHISLVRYYRKAKAAVREEEETARQREHYRRRFEFHRAREERDRALEERRHRERAALAAGAGAREAVQAALTRVKARRSEKLLCGTGVDLQDQQA